MVDMLPVRARADDPAGAQPAVHDLPLLGVRPALPAYLRQLWGRREFLVLLALSRVRAENDRDRLGPAWVVLKPLINAVVYGAVFGLLLRADSRPDNFVPFLVAGVFVFAHLSSCLTDGAASVSGSADLVRSLRFPRAVLPLAVVVQRTVGLGAMTAVLLVVVVACGEPVRTSWLLVVPALALATVFAAGTALAAARLTVHLRDLAHLLPFLTRLLFYVSGIFYELDRVVTDPRALAVLELNPAHVYITLVRGALLTESTATSGTWVLGVLWALVALPAGLVFFWRAEQEYGRD